MLKKITSLLLVLFVASSFAGPVSAYGDLKACGNNICGSKGSYNNTAVQLRGVSLGWSNTAWKSADFFKNVTVNYMADGCDGKDGWRAEVIRAPLGIDGGTAKGGYEDGAVNKAGNKERIKTVVNAAIAKDIYVIIDWHSHNAHQETTLATEFFKEMAQEFGDKDNVIFEIFNEPLGIGWSDIKTYANTIINTIRQYSNNLILVGTPNWCQDVDAGKNDLLSDNNVAYVLHFYANSHKLNQFQSKIENIRGGSNGKPVFVSEYGTVSYGGDGNHNATDTDTWLNYLNTNKISHVAWNVNNDDLDGQTSSFFKPTFQASTAANWTDKNNMTASGSYIYDKLKAGVTNSLWTGGGSCSGGGSGETLIADFETEPYNYNRLGKRFYAYKVDDAKITNTPKTPLVDTTDKYEVITDGDAGHGKVAWLKEGFNVGTKSADYTVNGAVVIAMDVAMGSLVGCTALEYEYKGAKHTFYVNQRTRDGDSLTNGVEGDWNQPQAVTDLTPASTSWKKVTVQITDDLTPSWGDPKATAAWWVGMGDVHKLTWEIRATSASSTSDSQQSLMIDNIKCIGAELNLSSGGGGGSSSSRGSSSSAGSSSSVSSSSGGGSSSSVSSSSGGGSSSSRGSSSSNRSSSSANQSSSSSSEDTPIVLSKFAQNNALIAMQNAINLQVANNAVLQIFDLKGNLIRTQSFTQGSYVVRMADLPKGLYIVKGSNGSWRQTITVPIK